MRALLPLALLLTAACYSPRATPDATGQPDPYYGGYDYGAPLEATVLYHEMDGFATFRVNRPANVALFAMRPGAGMEMIYPRTGYGGWGTQFSAGSHSVRTAGSAFRLAGNWSLARGSSPMYILLVASEGPLDISGFRTTGRLAWMDHSTLTYSPQYALEALVEEVVTNRRSGQWTTAMQVVWPEGVWPDARDRYLAVRCPNGRVITVPERIYYSGRRLCPSNDQQPPQDTTNAENIKESTPTRTRPAGIWTQGVTRGELEEEMERIRELNGWTGERVARGGQPSGSAAAERDRAVSSWAERNRNGVQRPRASGRVYDPPPVRRERPASARPAERARRPEPAPATRRPAPKPERRPEAKPASRPRPAARPAPKPRPVRPAPSSRPERPAPRPKPKPKPDTN